MERIQLDAQVRDQKGKGNAGRLRRQGYIPAVLYGKDRDAMPLKVREMDLAQSIRSNAIIDLTIKGGEKEEKAVVMLKELQRGILKKEFVHADFHEISLRDKMVVSVYLELLGNPRGVQDGGVINHLLREVEVECLPTNIPDKLEVDISHLEVNDSLEVGKLEAPEGVEIITPADETIVAVVPPTADLEEEEEGEDVGDLDAEPAVIGEEDEEDQD